MNTRVDLVAEERSEYKINITDTLSSLTTVELISLILGTSSALNLQKARDILNLTDGSIKALSKLRAEELMKIKKIGKQKAYSILAALELGKRMQIELVGKSGKFDNAGKIFEYLQPRIGNIDHEEVYILLMNNAFNLIKAKRISMGGLTETSFDIRLILKEALLCNSTVIAVAHNHPSGNNKPSKEDDNVTQLLKNACKTMRIHLIDHVIVSGSNYYSYSENGNT